MLLSMYTIYSFLGRGTPRSPNPGAHPGTLSILITLLKNKLFRILKIAVGFLRAIFNLILTHGEITE